MTYKITITPDAIAQSVALKEKYSGSSHPFIETIENTWETANKVTKIAQPNSFTDEDKMEIGRGAMYAFDSTLAALVGKGQQLTIPIVKKHLENLGAPYPDRTILLFLQRNGAVPFSYGISIINSLLIELGESALPAQANNEEGVEFDFSLEVSNGSVYLKGNKRFNLIGSDSPLGVFNYKIELTPQGELRPHPITLELDENNADAKRIFAETQKKISMYSGEVTELTINKDIINRMASNVKIANKNNQPKKGFPFKTAALALLVTVFIGASMAVAGLGIAAAVFGIVTGSALLGISTIGLIAGGLAVAAVAGAAALITVAAVAAKLFFSKSVSKTEKDNNRINSPKTQVEATGMSTQLLSQHLGQFKPADDKPLDNPVGDINASGNPLFSKKQVSTEKEKQIISAPGHSKFGG